MFRFASLALLAVATALTIAACGSSSSDSTSSESSESADTSGVVAAAQKVVDEYQVPVSEFPGPESSPEPPADKSIVIVTCLSASAGCQRGADAATEAADSLGWSAKTIDGKGSPQAMNAGIRDAINVKADGLITVCVPNELVQDSVAAARKAGVAVIDICGYGKPGPEGPNVFINVPDGEKSGTALANFVIADSEGKAQIGLIRDPTFPAVRQFTDVGVGVLDEVCPQVECGIVAETTITIAELETTAGSKAVSFLQANPEIDYLWVPYDGMAAVLVPALSQAGFADKVKIVSTDGNEQNFSLIESGDMQVATVAGALEWAAYGAVDELVRILAGEKEIDGPTYTKWIPARLFTQDNIPATLPWKGELDYVAEYERLWGVGK
jgi:ABC-type sugar transport system substrate-binding protein